MSAAEFRDANDIQIEPAVEVDVGDGVADQRAREGLADRGGLMSVMAIAPGVDQIAAARDDGAVLVAAVILADDGRAVVQRSTLLVRDARAAGAYGMTQGNGAAAWIELRIRQAQVAHTGKCLHGESLVDFHSIDPGQVPAGLFAQ